MNWYNSSKDPNKLSLTLGGLSVMGISQLIVLILGVFGITVGQDEIAAIVTAIITGAGAIMFVIGGVRRIASKYAQ